VASWQGKLLDGTLKNKSLNLVIIIGKKLKYMMRKEAAK